MKINNYIDGVKVRQRRTELGLSQTQLARLTETTDAYVSKLENSDSGTDCGIAFALRLAKSLDTNVESIVSEFNVN